MNKFKSISNTMILYTTATCNLNCVYCFIDKNSALKTIDNYLDDSYYKTPDYYIDFSKEIFEKDKLTEMQFWGGEPFLALRRAYYTVEECIKYYPNLSAFMASTNFAHDTFFEEFYGFLDILKKYPDRKFTFRLQLSCDGPKYINDVNRGEGVTDKIITHFEKLIQELQNSITDNITIKFSFKPTLDSNTIEKLQSKEKVIEYFSFFENFMDVFKKYNKKKNLIFNLPIPNTACPSPHTKQDGLNFANYCRLCREIEKEKVMRYYRSITSFKPRYNYKQSSCSGYCGNGYKSLGLLPNRKISCCHNGFVDLISDYKKRVMEDSTHMENVVIEKELFKGKRNTLIFDFDSKDFTIHQEKVGELQRNKFENAKIANMTTLIRLLAMHKQIDEKYADSTEAYNGARFLCSATSYCVRDNLGVTGSLYLYPVGLIKLLLNGAREYIEEKAEKV